MCQNLILSCVKKILLLVFALLILTCSARAAGQHFYFVQITDTHLGVPGNLKRTQTVVDAVNALPMEVACVVHTGDMIDRRKHNDKKTLQEALRVFGRLEAPVHFLAGNNDIKIGMGSSMEEEIVTYEKSFGSLISHVEYRGVVFLLAYTDPLRESVTLEGYDPLKALRQKLDGFGEKPVVLFHHGPCVTDFYNNAFHDGWDKGVKDRWVELINRYNVKGVITGHFHRDEFHWLGKVPLYVAPPVAEKYGRQASFRIYEYKNGMLEYTTQYIE